MLTRLLSRKTYTQPSLGMSLTFIENTWGYLETNVVVTMNYPDSIKLMIGAYDIWFGTDEGSRLREWCIAQGWPLVWAHNPFEATWTCSDACITPTEQELLYGIDRVNVRILDPYVLNAIAAGRNATQDPDYLSASVIFNQSWFAVNTTISRDASKEQRRDQADVLWDDMLAANVGGVTLLNSTLAVEPLFVGACSNVDCAAVRIKDGACICN